MAYFPPPQTFNNQLAELITEACRFDRQEELPPEFYAPFLKAFEEAYVDVYRKREYNDAEYRQYLEACTRSLFDFTVYLQPLLPTGSSPFTVAFSQVLSEPYQMWKALTQPLRLLPSLFNEYSRNLSIHSYETYDEWKKDADKNDKRLEASLGSETFTLLVQVEKTPLEKRALKIAEALAAIEVPFILDREARFHGTWVISPTGTGKTTLLENLIYTDLEEVARNEASIVVIDSQKELISHILSSIDPKWDKVVYLQPNLDHPLALNLFDSRVINYSKSQELADFVLGAIAGKLTEKQAGLFRYLAKAMQVIPDATIMTLAELLRAGTQRAPNPAYEKYREYIQQLDSYTVQFFETRFNNPIFASTKEEIASRLDTVMSDDLFRGMFTTPRNRLNLAREIDDAKIILVDTNALTGMGRQMLGRFVIAMLDQATQNRLLSNSRPMPVYAYLDECQDYIADEPLIAKMIDKVRKQRVALTFAHQRLRNIPNPDVMDAVANCRVKFAGKMDTDAEYVARRLRVDADTLTRFPAKPPYRMALNQGHETVVLTVPQSKLTQRENRQWIATYQQRMIDRYCVLPGLPQPEWQEEEPESPVEAEVVVPMAKAPVATTKAIAKVAKVSKPRDDIPL